MDGIVRSEVSEMKNKREGLMEMEHGETLRRVERELNRVLVGKEDVVRKVLTAILAGGHILLEDVPGVGKTTLALALSKSMSMSYRRTQFTPDVMPSDVVGFCVYNKETNKQVYKPGNVMCNLYLADEINRTSSKTQSALLEVMEEGNVTVDGVTRAVPKPFHVIATQNPLGSAGTQMLPDSQLDRFMIRVSIGYPDLAAEVAMMKARSDDDPMDYVQCILQREELFRMQMEVRRIFVHTEIYEYVASLAQLSRKNEYLASGISPRGSLAIIAMAKANAYMEGRTYVLPDDVTQVFVCTAAHRLQLTPMARVSRLDVNALAEEMLRSIKPPKIAVR